MGTKVGWSEIKRESSRRENTEGERERECPSNGYREKGEPGRNRGRTSPQRTCAIALQQGATERETLQQDGAAAGLGGSEPGPWKLLQPTC